MTWNLEEKLEIMSTNTSTKKHIKPCFSYDLTDSKQQQECFNYKNLQPLFKTTKIAKSLGYENYIGNRDKSKKF